MRILEKMTEKRKLIANILGVWLEVCYILLQQGQILCLLLVYYQDSCKNQAKCILELQSMFYATCEGAMDYGIMYKFGGDLNLIGYSDSDWAGSIDDMKSTSSYAFLFG